MSIYRTLCVLVSPHCKWLKKSSTAKVILYSCLLLAEWAISKKEKQCAGSASEEGQSGQAAVSEQVGSLIHKPDFSLIVKAQEKLKEDSNQKDGRNKKEDEGLERWNRYIVRSDLKNLCLIQLLIWDNRSNPLVFWFHYLENIFYKSTKSFVKVLVLTLSLILIQNYVGLIWKGRLGTLVPWAKNLNNGTSCIAMGGLGTWVGCMELHTLYEL